jgi:spermidine synthase
MTEPLAQSHAAPGEGVADAAPAQRVRIHPKVLMLLASVFIVAACGLLYELAAGALASYLLGDSVLQFSTIIGAYLFAMGLGSYASRWIERQLVAQFVRIELLVGFVGGFMPMALFVLHTIAPSPFRVFLYGMVLLVGFLAGLEIPVVMRLLKRDYALKDLVSQVLTFDYLGALAISVAFPLVLVPQLGLMRSGLLFGLLNALVAVWAMWVFRRELRRFKLHLALGLAVVAMLAGGFVVAERLTRWLEERFYQERIVFASSSPYQRVVVTRGKTGVRLFLNGNLQFAERDEYRYHEALVHPVMASHGAPKRVAVLGGGDGMAVREVLKYASVESVTLVELDPKMTELFAREPMLSVLNDQALANPKVRIVNADAYAWLTQTTEVFDVVIVDFPDPSNHAIGKLFTDEFYRRLDQRLSASGYAVVQSTSPLIARQSFWTVVTTIESVGLTAQPYHAFVPSFGEWGFVVASRRPLRDAASVAPELPAGLRFVDAGVLQEMTRFPPDMARVPAEVHRLHAPVLVAHFEDEWGKVKE